MTGPAVAGRFDDHARLFLMPGTGHCGGGPGANTADYLTALEQWIEHGAAPDTVLARHEPSPFGPPEPAGPALERPICAYPAQPVYQGGDPNAAASFRCE